MPTNSAAATRTVPTTNPVLAIAAGLLGAGEVDTVAVACSHGADGDVLVDGPVDGPLDGSIDRLIDWLVDTARFNAHQLKLLVQLVDRVACADTVVLDAYDHARAFEACDAAAVGAAASMLEVTALGDERQMGEHLAGALAAFDADELLLGAAALTAAFSTTIADWLDLDADEVHVELVAALGESPRRGGTVCLRGVGRRLRQRSSDRRFQLVRR